MNEHMTHLDGGKGMQIFSSGANAERKRSESAEVTDCKAFCYFFYHIANFLVFADLRFINRFNIC